MSRSLGKNLARTQRATSLAVRTDCPRNGKSLFSDPMCSRAGILPRFRSWRPANEASQRSSRTWTNWRSSARRQSHAGYASAPSLVDVAELSLM